MDHIMITNDSLNVDEAVKTVTSPSSGAISLFIGTTRDNCDGKTVVKLEYEAYPSMAEKQLQKICKEVRQKWSVEHICIFHRLGEVPIAEASVVIAISSPHRQESLASVQYAIDKLKATVPIWKKEIYANDTPLWKENKECTWSTLH